MSVFYIIVSRIGVFVLKIITFGENLTKLWQ